MQEYNLQIIDQKQHCDGKGLADFLNLDPSFHSEQTGYLFQNMPWCKKYEQALDSIEIMARKIEQLGPYIQDKEVPSKLLTLYQNWASKYKL